MSIRICVYAICKNESKFVGRWLDSMSEADSIVVLDTGSSDGTYEMLKNDPRVDKVRRKKIVPWRFDVARNESLKLIPEDADILVCTDLDEVFDKGWADVLRSNWKIGETTRAMYTYTHSFSALGDPVDVFLYSKIHSKGYHWRYPAHEVLYPDEGKTENIILLDKEIHLKHYPDASKGRGYYADLVKLGAEENPMDAHAQILQGRELVTAQKFDEALAKFDYVLSLPHINENVFMMQKYYALLSKALIFDKRRQEEKLRECIEEMLDCDPTFFEPHLLLAESYLRQKLYGPAADAVERALRECHRHYTWFEIPYTFLGWPQEILAIAKGRLGEIDEALRLIEEPLKYAPYSPRLLKRENALLKIKLMSCQK